MKTNANSSRKHQRISSASDILGTEDSIEALINFLHATNMFQKQPPHLKSPQYKNDTSLTSPFF